MQFSLSFEDLIRPQQQFELVINLKTAKALAGETYEQRAPIDQHD
jgi:hypothetical protein